MMRRFVGVVLIVFGLFLIAFQPETASDIVSFVVDTIVKLFNGIGKVMEGVFS